MVLNDRSEKNLVGVHPDLVRVVRKAALLLAEGPLGFIVTEGLRTKESQELLVAVGASKTMDSRHLTGHAVDLAATVNGDVRWDWPLYTTLSHLMKTAAEIEKVHITWGGDWLTFRDGPHFVGVGNIRGHGLADALFKIDRRPPTQLPLDLGRVDGVPPVMSRAILDEFDERGARPPRQCTNT